MRIVAFAATGLLVSFVIWFSVGALEGQYLAATKSLTPEKAQALGLVAPSQVSTVVVGKSSSLSFMSR